VTCDFGEERRGEVVALWPDHSGNGGEKMWALQQDHLGDGLEARRCGHYGLIPLPANRRQDEYRRHGVGSEQIISGF
jgi:hypothetical protein